MKKIIALLSLGALALYAEGGAPAPVSSGGNCATGFYVGANLGVSMFRGDGDQFITGYAGADSDPAGVGAQIFYPVSQNGLKLGKGGIGGGINVGYGYGYGCAYFFVEASLGFNGSSLEYKTPAQACDLNSVDAMNIGTGSIDNGTLMLKYKISQKFNYGLVIGAGYFVTPSTMLYLKAGIDSGKYKMDLSADGAAASDGFGNSLGNPIKTTTVASKSKINFALGGGVKVFVHKNVFVDAGLTYVFGPKLTSKDMNLVDGTVFGANALNARGVAAYAGIPAVSVCKTNEWRFRIGAGYKF